MICCAIKKDGKQCTRRSTWKFPNIHSGTGIGVDDWKYGRSVNLCNQHARPFNKDKTPIRLIHGGYLQPYNKYKYGYVVLDKVIDWATDDLVTTHFMPKYWGEGDKKMLNVRMLEVMSPGPFATIKIGDYLYVAVRGGIADWAIYMGLASYMETDDVARGGDKVYDETVIRKIVPCDNDSFKRYRY